MTEHGQPVLEFAERKAATSHAEFEAWRRVNPRGFVLNMRPGTDGMLHFAECVHMEFEEGSGVSLTRNAKLASKDAVALLLDAMARGLAVTICSSCRPRAVGQL